MTRRNGLTWTARVAAIFGVLLLGISCVVADDWITPFNGKDLSGWKPCGNAKDSQWKVGTAALKEGKPNEIVAKPGGNEMVNTVPPHSVDLATVAKFGDVLVELEVMVPRGANSGIYLMGEYEIQVLDSSGRKNVGPGDMGGIYNTKAPKLNACKAPGEWQKYVIEFRAPRFDEKGKKTANAKFIKVVLNDQVIHENVEAPRSTGGGVTGRDNPTGPLMFQGNHGPVAFRNIKIKPLGEAK